jgi:hypothetical protein
MTSCFLIAGYQSFGGTFCFHNPDTEALVSAETGDNHRRITGFSDFVHRPVFKKLENTTLRKLDLFPSSGEGGNTYRVEPLRKSYPQPPEDVNRSSFRNVVFSNF